MPSHCQRLTHGRFDKAIDIMVMVWLNSRLGMVTAQKRLLFENENGLANKNLDVSWHEPTAPHVPASRRTLNPTGKERRGGLNRDKSRTGTNFQ
jgi:hypothetical protein